MSSPTEGLAKVLIPVLVISAIAPPFMLTNGVTKSLRNEYLMSVKTGTKYDAFQLDSGVYENSESITSLASAETDLRKSSAEKPAPPPT